MYMPILTPEERKKVEELSEQLVRVQKKETEIKQEIRKLIYKIEMK